jgi:hypothetical protein
LNDRPSVGEVKTRKKKIKDGQYSAMWKERNALAAAMNGHGGVFLEARCMIANGHTVFKRD